MRLHSLIVVPLLMSACTNGTNPNSINSTPPQVNTQAQNNDNNEIDAHPLGLPTPRTIVGGLLNDRAIKVPQPRYPKAVRSANARGIVTVQVLIDMTGHVVSASALNGPPIMKAAAVQAARQAEFDPFIINGEAKMVSGVLTYEIKP